MLLIDLRTLAQMSITPAVAKQGLVKLDGLGTICEQGRKFSGAVSPSTAKTFVEYLQTPQEQRVPSDGKKLLEDLSNHLKKMWCFHNPGSLML